MGQECPKIKYNEVFHIYRTPGIDFGNFYTKNKKENYFSKYKICRFAITKLNKHALEFHLNCSN